MKNKKDSLEKFDDANREHFDSQTPSEVWPAIEHSLPHKSKQFFLNTIVFWRAAAIVFFAFSSYLMVNQYFLHPEAKDTSVIQGFSDLETFYTSQISEKMKLISHFESNDGVTTDDITLNLKKLDAMYQVLKDEMKRRPTQDVRDALILNLLVRVDLINQQLQKLDKTRVEVKKQKEV